MKAVLEFNMDEHEDLLAFRRCTNATDAYILLWKLNERMGQDDIPSKIRKVFFDIFGASPINLNDLP